MNMEANANQETNAPATPPQRKKIKLPAYRGLPGGRFDRKGGPPSWVQMSLLAGGILATVAIIADGTHFARVSGVVVKPQTPTDMFLSVSRATDRYVDPDRRFSIALPPGWTWQRKKNDEDYDLTLMGPERMQLAILVMYAPVKTLEELRKDCEETESEQRIVSHIEETKFKGHPAIQRFCRLKLSSFLALDVLAHGTAYHLMGTIPTERFESHRTVLSALIDSFEPIPPPDVTNR